MTTSEQATATKPATAPLSCARAIGRYLSRLAGDCGDAVPLFREQQNPQWQLSAGGSWMGGFWSGCWWLQAHLSGRAADRARALSICRQLAAKLHQDTQFRSMIFWYATAPGIALFNHPSCRELATAAARTLAQSFNEQQSFYPLGSALGGGPNGPRTLNVDAFAALLRLLQYGDENTRDSARRHARSVTQHLLADDGNFYANASIDSSGAHPLGRAGQWARGNSWGLLGLASAARLWDSQYRDLAERHCDLWWQCHGQDFPPSQQDADPALPDPSATLIAAIAMYKLDAGDSHWRKRANRLLQQLLDSPFFTRNTSSDEARFLGCSFRGTTGGETLGETVWGYFFLLQALLIAGGAIDPDTI
ncbi:hypothetical protein ACONUD_01360 [Microbulbifer harenosus]|uniref:Glucuronyl hydrolase n=1 Tax=Microbulbifer harenosus TaxID=2576840 RepID=A0ABY2UNU0_9GAMM|nr:hypothetical protein [Microbulbifer harenosus]TLM79550.1 hypothetical protein FDY93_01350 [Microbulbifer harenosus]